MADASRTQVLIALISVSGVLGAAVIANSDKLFGRPHEAPPVATADQAPPVARTADTSPAPGPMTEAHTTRAAPTVRPPPPAAAKPDATPDIAGAWRDADDGMRYVFTQKGSDYSYRAFDKGVDIGGGEGTLSGRAFSHRFKNNDGGEGACQGEFAPDGRDASGRCSPPDGSQNWLFSMSRE